MEKIQATEDILILKELSGKEYGRIYNHINKGHLERVFTDKGIGVYKDKLLALLSADETRGRKADRKAIKIDTSMPSKLNCLYKKLTDMNETNRNCCQRDNKLPRYVDQNNCVCINLKDYIKPQISLLAKKLECKQQDIFGALFELIHTLHLKNKGE